MTGKPTVVPGIFKVCEGVLINKDNEGLQAYKKRKEKDRQLDVLEKEFQSIKGDLNELKEMMVELLQKR